MEVFLVGGAVRDELLGRTVRERDWVVVGSDADEMLRLGYRRVGRDFPVFLHPESGEEYALARTERKTGPGHTGFDVHADVGVTLAEDLERRDLTINAMARAEDGALIDPWGGQDDLARRVLRHVSRAFTEDPLRVFRVARFAAQLPNFEVAAETRALIREMAQRDELGELSAERVWSELDKALDAPAPARFIAVLRDCDALGPWFVEFAAAEPVVGPGLEEQRQRYAAFVSGLSPRDVDRLSARLKAPRAHRQLARWLALHGGAIAGWRSAAIADLYAALIACRAFRPESDLASALAVVTAVAGVNLTPLVDAVAAVVEVVSTADLKARGLKGADLGRAIDEARMAALDARRS